MTHVVYENYFIALPPDGEIHRHIVSFLMEDSSALESLYKVDRSFRDLVKSLEIRIPIDQLSKRHDIILQGNALSKNFTATLSIPNDSVVIGSGWGRYQIFKSSTPVWKVVCLWLVARKSELDPNIDNNNISGCVKSAGLAWDNFVRQNQSLPAFTMRSDDTRTLLQFEASLNLPARVVWYLDTTSKAPFE